MKKNKKKLTKQERAQKQFAREQLHRKAKQDLLNSIEAHQFNTGDLVRVGDKVGTIVSLNDNLLNNKWSIGKQAFDKVGRDFYNNVAYWWEEVKDEQEFPEELREYLERIISSAHFVFKTWLEQENFEAFLDIPVACFDNGKGSWVVRSKTVMFNKEKDQYVVFNGMFDAFNWLDCNMEQDENVSITENSDGSGWYRATSNSIENSTIHGIFGELLDQAYAVKEKRSRNLGLYKVLYSGEMTGQKGKQQVLVAPCNIQAVGRT